ncbi:nucleotidyltransferase/DNA polymerase [Burkholderia pseudomallei]|nr:nucleotidyltransferase/DNA polymerase [Burkholderia pseudomallei]VCK73128.1 nucleotidyltransferase/DNA polymerase [Burkholderia pseudomallei]VCK79822.1 nucleotidyltransferase/DNA polymerase [Burkholderia pseudomallei]VCK80206.1 nucleotidyltransferase/DNA polymerase [Burkholderia pseudomallei]VCK80987.1 nucleotidyltransferase/DNA polymerase [Burkholderia pseudomallei]
MAELVQAVEAAAAPCGDSPGGAGVGAHAVIESGQVIALTRAAREAGVRIGMRRAGALTIAPDVQLVDRAPEKEAEALGAAALAMLRFTPNVARMGDDALVLDVSSSLRLFGGVRAILRQARQAIADLGLTARFSLAPTASGAWLLARQPGGSGAAHAASAGAASAGARALRRRVAKLPTLARCLDRLPFGLLPETQRTAAWIDGIGCKSLGDLRRLPRAGLKRRCGPALLDAMDRAYGEAAESFEWEVAPPTFDAKVELPDRVEHAEALLFAGRRLIVQLTGWLAAQHLVVTRFALLLDHERGRAAIEPTRLDVALADATGDTEHLARLLKERLGRLTLPAPVIAVCLLADETREKEGVSDSLFPDPAGSAGDFAQLVELLTARLGAENVLQPALAPDHRPERLNAWMPAEASARATPAGRHAKVAAASLAAREEPLPLRPFWLLDEPIALLTRQHRPFYGSPLRVLGKGERVESGWFDSGLVTRDYFVAESEQGARYWVFRERIGRATAGSDASGDAPGEIRWFLHGLFA